MAEFSATEICLPEPLNSFQRQATLGFRMAKSTATDPREITFYEDLAHRLDAAVEAVCALRGMSRGQVADAIGVSLPRLSNWTTNQNKPDWFGIYRFCKQFKVSTDWLILGDVSQLPHSLAVYLVEAGEDTTAA